MHHLKDKNTKHNIAAGVNIFYLLFEILTSSIGLSFIIYIFTEDCNTPTCIIMSTLLICLLAVLLRSIILLILYGIEIRLAKFNPLELSSTLIKRKNQLLKIQLILTKIANLSYLIYDYSIFIIWFLLLALLDYILIKQYTTVSFIICIISLFFWAVGIDLLRKKLK